MSSTPDMLVARARVAVRSDRLGEARFALKQAERLAREGGDIRLAAELSGNQAILDVGARKVGRAEALRRIGAALESAPMSLPLADMAASLCYTTSECQQVLGLVEVHNQEASTIAMSFKARMAYLAQNWLGWRDLVREWVGKYPHDENAVAAHLSVLSHVENDWDVAAIAARQALRRGNRSVVLVNQCAYILAMAGRGDEAKAALEQAPTGITDSKRPSASHA